jgi:tRNA threonylcarbamoyl adenosine modification protein YeaZ
MKTLALEFSSDLRSVAVADGTRLLGVSSEKGGRSTRAVALIESALQQASLEREQIECIAVGIGPGSYTGIRAGIALAQGWQLARNTKVLAISSAEAIALSAQAQSLFGRVTIVIDAQRNEYYGADYEITSDAIRETATLTLLSQAEIGSRASDGRTIVGPDAPVFGGILIYPDAAMIVRFGATRTAFIPAERLEPIYLRETTFVKAPPPRNIP